MFCVLFVTHNRLVTLNTYHERVITLALSQLEAPQFSSSSQRSTRHVWWALPYLTPENCISVLRVFHWAAIITVELLLKTDNKNETQRVWVWRCCTGVSTIWRTWTVCRTVLTATCVFLWVRSAGFKKILKAMNGLVCFKALKAWLDKIKNNSWVFFSLTLHFQSAT